MPIYEYRCDSCAYMFDALQKISDPPLKECPDCGALELRRLVSAPSFRLKGGGWYETDFKSEKERKRNLAERREAGADSDGKGDKADKSDKSDKSEKKGEKKDEKKSKPDEGKKKSGSTDAVA